MNNIPLKGNDKDRKWAISSRINGGWEVLFALEGLPYQNEDPINIDDLKDASHPFTKAILRLYSLETWI